MPLRIFFGLIAKLPIMYFVVALLNKLHKAGYLKYYVTVVHTKTGTVEVALFRRNNVT